MVRILISITVVEFQTKKKRFHTLETLRSKLGHIILPQKAIRGLRLAVSRYPSAHI